MATRKRAGKSTNGTLEAALTNLINNQALFIGHMARADERFARIEGELAEIKGLLLDHQRILLDHQRLLEALPEAIREKIGFVKPQ